MLRGEAPTLACGPELPMRTNARFAQALVLALAASACSQSAAVAQQQPITRTWLTENFLSAISPPPDSVQKRRNDLWARVRNRQETVTVLIEIFDDSTQGAFIRANALLRLGSTGQSRAYEFLIGSWPRLEKTRFATEAIVALGNAPESASGAAVEQLKIISQRADPGHRYWAANMLGNIPGHGVSELLRGRLNSETDESVRRVIRKRLAERGAE